MDIDAFIRDGYTVVRGAFDADTARGCRDMIWSALATEHGILAHDRRTWDRPVERVKTPGGEPFAAVATAPPLVEAYDALIGAGRWTRRDEVGGDTVIRFPSEEDPGDVGYHVEGNTWGGEEYHTDLRSKGRGLLLLILFTDVGLDDTPTRLITGSHRYVPPILSTVGDEGLGGGTVAARLNPSVLCRQSVYATGRAGDVFLCHPFLVHTGIWPHRGTEARMVAQPGVEVPDGFAVDGSDPSPVARAIVDGLHLAAA